MKTRKRRNIPKKASVKPDADPAASSPASGLKFKDGRFLGINIETTPAILLAEKEYWGHHNVIFSGLRAWLIASRNLAASRHAIAAASAALVQKVEKSQAYQPFPSYMATARFDPRKSDFYDRIYHQIGGMAAIRKALLTAPKAERNNRKAKKQIQYLAATGLLWDYHVRLFLEDKKRFGVPALVKSAPFVHRLMGPGAKKRKKASMRDYWRPHWRAIAFLYAAKLVKLKKGGTILDRLVDGTLLIEDAKPAFARWFGYALYFTESVLPHIQLRNATSKTQSSRNRKSKANRFPKLRGVRARKPKLPQIDPELRSELEESFSKKKESERVVRHP